MNEKNSKINHYVYRLDDPVTGEFYIGSRSCECDISDDTYMGSYKRWKPEDKSRLTKTIIRSDFNNRKDANLYESHVIDDNINDELNRNYHNLVNFCTFGMKIENPPPVLPEVRRKISESVKQYFKDMTDEQRKNFSQTMSKSVLGEKNPFYGKHHTNETKLKMKDNNSHLRGKTWEEIYGEEESLRKREFLSEIKNKFKKPVIQYTLDGVVVNEYASTKEAIRQTGICHIACVCKGTRNKAGGFTWKYK